jgi:integrase
VLAVLSEGLRVILVRVRAVMLMTCRVGGAGWARIGPRALRRCRLPGIWASALMFFRPTGESQPESSLRSGYAIRTRQGLLGHVDVSTTMIYLHVLDEGSGVKSPLDALTGPHSSP